LASLTTYGIKKPILIENGPKVKGFFGLDWFAGRNPEKIPTG
jgi:hypothetical protein